jgi:hypothetical protein
MEFHMDNDVANRQSLAQSSDNALEQFKVLNNFAQISNITISGIYVYIGIGALNITKLDDERMMFTPVTPARAASALNLRPKRIGRWLITLADRGLLLRDHDGGYKVADLNTWLVLSRLVSPSHLNVALFAEDQESLDEIELAKFGPLAARSGSQSMRDRL